MKTRLLPSSHAQAPVGFGAPQLFLVLAALFGLRLLISANSGAGLHVDEAQYWDWSRDLKWGYFSKPPGIAAIIAASTGLWGDSVISVRALCMACWPLAAWVLWRLGSDMHSPSAGVWAAMLWMATPAAGLLGLVATTDGPLVLCWALLMWATWHAVQDARAGKLHWAAWLAAGTALGLGLLCKYSVAAAGLSCLLVALATRRAVALAGFAILCAVALALIAPHLMWNASHSWVTLQHTGDITVRAAAHSQGGLMSLLGFGGGLLVLLGPAAWLIAAACWRTKSAQRLQANRLAQQEVSADRSSRLFLACFIGPLLVVTLVQAAMSKAQINWAAPLVLPVCLALGLQAARLGLSRGLLVSSTLAGVLLSVLVAQAGLVNTHLGGTPSAQGNRWDIWSRMRGWNEALTALQPALRAHPGLAVVAADRGLIAHARHAWRDAGLRVSSWPARGAARNHYEAEHAIAPPWPRQLLVLIEAVDMQTPSLPGGEPGPLYRDWQLLDSARHGRVSLQLWLANQVAEQAGVNKP